MQGPTKEEINKIENVRKKMRKMGKDIDPQLDHLLESEAKDLLRNIQKNIRAQGLVVTGAYLGSWRVKKHHMLNWSVTTDHPAANRLEHGFVGMDAAGRHYAQAPSPHVGPARAATIPHYRAGVRGVIQRLWLRL